MQLIIFIGIQGAGKSTFFKQYFSDTHMRINGDMLKTRRREQILFEACLTSKTKTVIDKTNATPNHRQPYISQAIAHHFEIIAYYFDCPFDEALARNNKRTGKAKIPEVGVKGTFKKLTPPSFEEGFDKIYQVQLIDNEFIVKAVNPQSNENSTDNE